MVKSTRAWPITRFILKIESTQTVIGLTQNHVPTGVCVSQPHFGRHWFFLANLDRFWFFSRESRPMLVFSIKFQPDLFFVSNILVGSSDVWLFEGFRRCFGRFGIFRCCFRRVPTLFWLVPADFVPFRHVLLCFRPVWWCFGQFRFVFSRFRLVFIQFGDMLVSSYCFSSGLMIFRPFPFVSADSGGLLASSIPFLPIWWFYDRFHVVFSWFFFQPIW